MAAVALFYRCSLDLLYFLPPSLQGRLANCHQTLPRDRFERDPYL